MNYLEVCCLIFKYLGSFYIFLLLLLIPSLIHCGLRTLYDCWSFRFKMCFMTQNVICLDECPMRTREECGFCWWWMEYSVNAN